MAEKKTYLTLGIGVAGVAVAAYLLYRRKKTPDTEQTFNKKQDKIETFEEKYSRVINRISTVINEKNIQDLNPQLMKLIYQGHYQLANDEARQIILKARRRRRRNIHNKEEYCKICQKCQQEMEQLLDKHLGAILARFKIDKTYWMNETSRWSSTNQEAGEQWANLLRDEDEKQLDSLRNKALKPKSFSLIRNILEYKQQQLEIFKADQFFIDGDLDESLKFSIVQAYIQDMVFDKFAVQQEDIEYSISTFNPQLKQQLEPRYERISELITDLIYGQDDYQTQNDQSIGFD